MAFVSEFLRRASASALRLREPRCLRLEGGLPRPELVRRPGRLLGGREETRVARGELLRLSLDLPGLRFEPLDGFVEPGRLALERLLAALDLGPAAVELLLRRGDLVRAPLGGLLRLHRDVRAPLGLLDESLRLARLFARRVPRHLALLELLRPTRGPARLVAFERLALPEQRGLHRLELAEPLLRALPRRGRPGVLRGLSLRRVREPCSLDLELGHPSAQRPLASLELRGPRSGLCEPRLRVRLDLRLLGLEGVLQGLPFPALLRFLDRELLHRLVEVRALGRDVRLPLRECGRLGCELRLVSLDLPLP